MLVRGMSEVRDGYARGGATCWIMHRVGHNHVTQIKNAVNAINTQSAFYCIIKTIGRNLVIMK